MRRSLYILLVMLMISIVSIAQPHRQRYYDYFRPLEYHTLSISFNTGASFVLGSRTITAPPSQPYIGGSLEYVRWVHRYWGIAIGATYRENSLMMNINAQESFPLIDAQSQPYIFMQSIVAQEKLFISQVSVPISVQYRLPVRKRSDLLFAAGCDIAYRYYAHYSLDRGYLSRKVWYEQFHLMIDDLTEKQLGEFDLKYQSLPTPAITQWVYSPFFRLTYRYEFFDRCFLNVSACIEYTVSSLVGRTDDYDVRSQYTGRLNFPENGSLQTLNFGCQIGLSFALGKRHRGGYWEGWKSRDGRYIRIDSQTFR